MTITGSPFQIRAVIEGFYGVYYTAEERNDLIRFLAHTGYTSYIYGPKNDWYHRTRWREPYPPDILAQLASGIATAREVGLEFCYAASPGVSMCYSSKQDFTHLTDKLRIFFDLGVRAFSLFLDDISLTYHCGEDNERYRSVGEAHADVTNRLYAWLQALDPSTSLSMAPTLYHGSPPFDAYLYELGASLHPAIDIFYTGAEVCSATITGQMVQAVAEVLRRPPLLWDNYPVNDLRMASEMHIGPIVGRDPALGLAARGIAVNPMNQAEASKIPLLTYADYMVAPDRYDPARSWERALRQVGGDAAHAALRLFAENSLASCLGVANEEPMARRCAEALAALLGGAASTHPAVVALETYLQELEVACYYLKNRMVNLALRNQLVPWFELMEQWVWVGKRALMALHALEAGRGGSDGVRATLRQMEEGVEAARMHPKRWGGDALEPLARYVRERAASVVETEARYAVSVE